MMKKISNAGNRLLILVMTMMLYSTVANAQDCALAVNKLCTAFNNMAKQAKAITTLEELENINFDKAINDSKLDEIPDDCASYVLTKEDKAKLCQSFNGMVDNMSSKVVELANGMVSKEIIDEEFAPMKNQMKSAVDASRTLSDLVDTMNNIF